MSTVPEVAAASQETCPYWFCLERSDFYIARRGKDLKLVGRDGEIRIDGYFSGPVFLWVIDWSKLLTSSRAVGRVYLAVRELMQAFRFDNRENEEGRVFQLEGKYIRAGSFLNIPGPGTGDSSDSCLSVFLSEDIQSAVRDLIRSKD